MRFTKIHLIREILLRVWGIISALQSLELLVGGSRNILAQRAKRKEKAGSN